MTSLRQKPIGKMRSPTPKVGLINRVAGSRVVTVTANVAEGAQSATVQQDVMARLPADLGPGIAYVMKGEDEERARPAPS
jgi:multidrug efflux pump